MFRIEIYLRLDKEQGGELKNSLVSLDFQNRDLLEVR